MIYSLTGQIVEVTSKSVAIEVNGVGYEINVSRPEDFALFKECKVFTHEIITQDDHYLVGFVSKLEKDAFLSLIQVKGIGPKTALSALSKTNPTDLFLAISSNDVGYLKKLPGIGPKAASQIILDLKGKLIENNKKGNSSSSDYEEVRGALSSLGFKSKEIDDALSKLDRGLSTQDALRLALKGLRK
ncbi:MAG TPA: Holliday junction branch migration protein RuvA [Firmicutes bacterium]|nr:Holliday junction branch migration protein RuvA [Bacillota bacterium]